MNAKPCFRCNSYATRLSELNRQHNILWDMLVRYGIDPETGVPLHGKGIVGRLADSDMRFRRALRVIWDARRDRTFVQLNYTVRRKVRELLGGQICKELDL